MSIALRTLPDDQIVVTLKDCVATERTATAKLIAVLAEFDLRRLHLAQGFSSTFDYCVRHLHFSERASYSRIAAARLARRFPVVLELVADSRISLTTVSLLAQHLNESNHQQLLAEATHKTTRQVEVIVARLAPQPDAPTLVRKVGASPCPRPNQTAAEPSPTLVLPPVSAPLSLPPSPQVPRAVVRPLAPERYKVQFTISEETRGKLRAIQDLLRHSIPNGDLAAVFDRALTALLADLEKKKLAIVRRPRAAPRQQARRDSRHIPAAVQRAVWRRDKGRCAFVGSEGRCRERGGLELHHVKPFAAGGEATVDNIQLRCRAHNSHEMELYFDPRART